MSSLHLRDLTVERGGRAVVRDVSLEIAAGPTAEVLRDENVVRAYLGTEPVS